MLYDRKIWVAQSDKNLYLLPSMANRHGLIAGATGTGKTITMKVMAESFSDLGVPVFHCLDHRHLRPDTYRRPYSTSHPWSSTYPD